MNSNYFTLTECEYDINIVQNIRSELVTGATLSIIHLDEARNYLRQDESIENELIQFLIYGATGKIEQELGGVAICQQIWKQTQQGGCKSIKLLRQPIIEISEIKYHDTFESTGTLIVSSNYRTVQPNILYHKDGYFKQGRDGDGYEITYECGLFTTATIETSNDPKLYVFKTAILRTVAWLYEQREEFMSGHSEGEFSVQYNQQILGRLLPIGIKNLIMPFHSGTGLI